MRLRIGIAPTTFNRLRRKPLCPLPSFNSSPSRLRRTNVLKEYQLARAAISTLASGILAIT